MVSGSESLSSILGWMSISCWIVVYSPQIIENYQLKSGEGLSVAFVLIWLVGDLCNLVGAVLAGLLPTIIILAAYYTVCDLVLLAQIYYYRWTNPNPQLPSILVSEPTPRSDSPSEGTPLLSDESDAVARHPHKRQVVVKQFIKYTAAVIFVSMTGVAAWAIDEHIHRNQPRSNPEEVVEWRSQLLGWASAIMFLKNLRTRCEGLSPALFMFSIAGNTTYSLSIFAASLDLHHLIANAAWLAGSGLTVFLDVFVLFQFFYYQAFDRHVSEYGEQ